MACNHARRGGSARGGLHLWQWKLLFEFPILTGKSAIRNPQSEIAFDIGPSRSGERAAIDRITRASGVFVGEELDTPSQLFDEFLEDPSDPGGYQFLSCRLNGETIGFACYGKADFAVGTYDLYWIAVTPDHYGSGVARALFRQVVASLHEIDARLLVIWTSGRPDYARARGFYESVGCRLEARIQDFYDGGDDLCIYSYRIRET